MSARFVMHRWGGSRGNKCHLTWGVRRAAQALPDPRSAGSRRMAGPGMRGPTYWLVRGSPLLGFLCSVTPIGTSVKKKVKRPSFMRKNARRVSLRLHRSRSIKYFLPSRAALVHWEMVSAALNTVVRVQTIMPRGSHLSSLSRSVPFG